MYPEENNKQRILIFAGAGFLILVFVIFAVVSQLAKNSGQSAQVATPTAAPSQGSSGDDLFTKPPESKNGTSVAKPPAAGVIAKVGDELIYNSDISTEVAALPNSDDPSIIQQSFEKIVTDSITLQGAAREKYITLDSTVFNSPTKDYKKRIKLVEEAKNKIMQNRDGYTGSFVSIWFYNQKPGNVGYEKGKQIAFNTIKPLYDDVKSGKITMEQAGDAIANDDNLYDVDEAFKVNAYSPFTATHGEPAFFDEGFNTIVSRLKVGEVSPLYTAKDENDKGTMIDALYIFAKVDKIISNKGYSTFEEWLVQNKTKYETVQY